MLYEPIQGSAEPPLLAILPLVGIHILPLNKLSGKTNCAKWAVQSDTQNWLAAHEEPTAPERVMHTTQQFHQRRMYIHTETCAQTSTAALFVIAKVEKILCLPATDECISKMSITRSQRGHGVDSYYNVDEP